MDVTQKEKDKQACKIQTLYAHYLFNNKRFQEAMNVFSKAGTDPYEVIRLFPDLLTLSSNNPELNNPTPSLPKLQDHDLEKGLRALIAFLTEVRIKLVDSTNGTKTMTAVAVEQLLKITDTTLLKCYLQVIIYV